MSHVSSTPATPPESARDSPASELRLGHYKARRDQLLRERRNRRAEDAAYLEEYEGLVEELRTAEQKLVELAGRYGRPTISPVYLPRAEAGRGNRPGGPAEKEANYQRNGGPRDGNHPALRRRDRHGDYGGRPGPD